MLDIHQLNVFLVAAEMLNFTHAAQKLHMTQPSVSQHIQALERHFNQTLFVRSGRRLELTEAGMALIPLAREAVALSVRIEESIASLSGEVSGHLQVGCSTTPGKYLLPHLLALFHHRHPQVRVTCHVASQHQTMQMLSDGELHFALTSLSTEYFPALESSKFFCDEVCFIVPNDHPWAERGIIDPSELLEAEYILREESSGTFAAVKSALAESGIHIEELDSLLTLGNSEAIALAIQEGLGVGFVSKMIVERLNLSGVTCVHIDGIHIGRDIYISRNIRQPASVAQNAFWDFVHSEENPLLCNEQSVQDSMVLNSMPLEQ